MDLLETAIDQTESLQYYTTEIQKYEVSKTFSEMTTRLMGAVAISCEAIMTIGCFIRTRSSEDGVPHPDDIPFAAGIKERVAQHRAILEVHGLKGIDMLAEFRANDRAIPFLEAGKPITKVIESVAA